MKKFLFTLAALLVAGTAFADSYLYVAKTDYANATPGDLVIPVRAHYEELVSAWQADFTFPEGIFLLQQLELSLKRFCCFQIPL